MPRKEPAEMTAEDVLKELVEDVLAVGKTHVRKEWPDLLTTFDHAIAVLAKNKRMRHDSKKPMLITKWIRTGELSEGDGNVRDLLESLGNLLDSASSHEIFGDIIFECEDGITYVATVEGHIGQIHPDHLKTILEQDDAEKD